MSASSPIQSTDSLMQETRTFPPSDQVRQNALLNEAQYKEWYQRSIHDPNGFWLE